MVGGMEAMYESARAAEERRREARNRDETYNRDLRAVLNRRKEEYPDYHVVICFHSAATITWSVGSRWLLKKQEEELSPGKYKYDDSWYSVLYVVLEGKLEYSHPGLSNDK